MLKTYLTKALREPESDETPLSPAEVVFARERALVLTPRAVWFAKARARYERRRAFRGNSERS